MRRLWVLICCCSASVSAQTYWGKVKTEASTLLQSSLLQEAQTHGLVKVQPMHTFFQKQPTYATHPTVQKWVCFSFLTHEYAESLLPQLDLATYFEEQPVQPPYDITPPTGSFLHLQSYHQSNPGHGFEAAWNLGFTGQGFRLLDIEYGFHKTHEEFHQNPFAQLESGITVNASAYFDYINHGTATLGVLVADPGEYGVTGMVHDAEVTVFTEWPSTGYNRVAAITRALDASQEGDVLLFEMQTYLGAATPVDIYAPAEYNLAVWELTQLATSTGRIVVAAAGNGAQNLDDAFYQAYRDRGDSGAILVGAGSNTMAHQPEWYSNYGERVNVQAWGTQVLTSGFGDYIRYNNDINQAYGWYGGTSSASALTAAAATLLQQAADQYLGRWLTSTEIRDILIETGHAQLGLLQKNIGPSINVEAAIAAVQALSTSNSTSEELRVYPNPSAGRFNWQTTQEGEWTLYNVLGQVIEKGNIATGSLNLSGYAAGMYTVRFQIGVSQKTVKLLKY